MAIPVSVKMVLPINPSFRTENLIAHIIFNGSCYQIQKGGSLSPNEGDFLMSTLQVKVISPVNIHDIVSFYRE